MTFGHVARLQIVWQAPHLANLEVQMSLHAKHLCGPRSADFVAGATPGEPRLQMV